jgi:hypothetical protein
MVQIELVPCGGGKHVDHACLLLEKVTWKWTDTVAPASTTTAREERGVVTVTVALLVIR